MRPSNRLTPKVTGNLFHLMVLSYVCIAAHSPLQSQILTHAQGFAERALELGSMNHSGLVRELHEGSEILSVNHWTDYSVSFQDNSKPFNIQSLDSQVPLKEGALADEQPISELVDKPSSAQLDSPFPLSVTNQLLANAPLRFIKTASGRKPQSYQANPIARRDDYDVIHFQDDGSAFSFTLGLPGGYSIIHPKQGVALSIANTSEPRTAILSGFSLAAILAVKRPKHHH